MVDRGPQARSKMGGNLPIPAGRPSHHGGNVPGSCFAFFNMRARRAFLIYSLFFILYFLWFASTQAHFYKIYTGDVVL